jgi:hypothetical protein
MGTLARDHFSPIDRRVALMEGSLEYRERVLNEALENSPQAIAQRVEVELLKNLTETAPWLIPYSIRQTI